MYYTFHPKEYSITLLIDCAKCLHENLFAHQRKAARAPAGAQGQHDFQKVLRQKSWALGNAEQRRKIRDSEMTFNLMFLCLCPVSAEQLFDCLRDVHLHAVPIKQTTSAGADAILGVTPSLCTEIRGLDPILKHAEHLQFPWIQQDQT